MEAHGSLVDCPFEQEFDDCLMKFEIGCSPWPMFVDYVKQTWLIPHKEKFVKAWMNKVMHLGNTSTNKHENCKYILVLGFRVQWMKIVVVFLLICVFQMQG